MRGVQGVSRTQLFVNTPDGEISVCCWSGGDPASPNLTVVTVHPWATLGGGEHNCVGIARELARQGLRVLTFELLASSAVWGVVTGHSSEVKQVVAICDWAAQHFGGSVLLLGSSAGAPMAGSALEQAPSAIGIAVIGYTFGWVSSIAFGSHFSGFLRSEKPKLFIMGEKDEFTSPGQLQSMVAKAHGSTNSIIVVPDVGHFQLESPAFDEDVAKMVLDWLRQSELLA